MRQLPEESLTLAFTERARALRASGIDVVSLTAGEPDWPTPDHVRQAAVEAIRDGFTRYTATEGIPELREAVADHFRRQYSVPATADCTLVATGAKQCASLAIEAIAAEGDEVVILTPHWVSYPAMVKLAGAVPVFVSSGLREGFLPDPAKIRAALTPRTRALVLNSPVNPSGAVFPEALLREIAAIAAEADITLISDEVYARLVYGTTPHCSVGALEEAAGRVVTINGVSKSHAMTGWRIGFMHGPADVIRRVAAIQGQTTGNANSVAQRAALAALTGPDEPVRAMVEEFRARRDLVGASLRRVPGITVHPPEGAMFFFFELPPNARAEKGDASYAAAVQLLERHRVGLVPGSAFGDARCLRLSYSVPRPVLEEGLRRLAEGLTDLRT
jgi:aspartate aminotransferase